MINKKYWLITSLLILFQTNVYAEEEQYKTSGQMTQEEYQRAVEARAEYVDCLNEQAYSMVEQQPDARVVADHSMKACSPVLEKFHTWLTMENYSPDFASRFVSSIANKAANNLLAKLLRVTAAIQSREN